MGDGIPFGHYHLIRRIARGGMAEVFLATQRGPEGFERQVAIKRILPHLADSPEFIDMFMDEARLAARLTHPHIAHIYEFGKVDDAYFIAMEYIDGIDLAPLILPEQSDPLPLTHVARIIADVAAGLHYAHQLKGPDGRSLGIVHRDISPQNIIVSFDGAVKIVDFGIAKAAHHMDRTNPGEIRGKFAYMSPEQTRGERLDGRADVFCLGIVLYELTTQRPLFSRTDPLLAMDQIRNVAPPVFSASKGAAPPAALKRIIERSLARDLEARYTDAAAMQLDLETFLHGRQEISNSLVLANYFREHYGLLSSEPAASSPTSPSVEGTVQAPASPGTLAVPHAAPSDDAILKERPDPPGVRDDVPLRDVALESTTLDARRLTPIDLPSDDSKTAILQRPPDKKRRRPRHHTEDLSPDDDRSADEDPTDLDTFLRDPPTLDATRHIEPLYSASPHGPERDHVATDRVPHRRHRRQRVILLGGISLLILGSVLVGYFLPMTPGDSSPHPGTTSTSDAELMGERSRSLHDEGRLDLNDPRATEAPRERRKKDRGPGDSPLAAAPPAKDVSPRDLPPDSGVHPRRVDAAPPPRLKTAARLRVLTRPRGAQVRVDGALITQRTPLTWRGPAGRHVLEIAHRGYRTEHRGIDLPAHRTITLRLRLRRRQSSHHAKAKRPPRATRPRDTQPGYLSVSTIPWSRVYLGRRLLGMSPFANVSLPPGRHRLRFVNPKRGSTTRLVIVYPGRVTKLRFTLP